MLKVLFEYMHTDIETGWCICVRLKLYSVTRSKSDELVTQLYIIWCYYESGTCSNVGPNEQKCMNKLHV